jgi:solute carrier family 25 carnitine/acylcarnitine transporter 20/29
MDTTGEVKKLYRTEGIRGFFKGFTVTACRQIPSLAIYFYVYKKFRTLLVSTTYMSEDIAIALSGGFAGCASWTTTYPLDVIKTHIQLSSLSSSTSFPSQANIFASNGTGEAHREGFQPPRKSVFQVAVALHRKHGFSVFYRGIGVCVLRAFPVNCVTFSVYELFKRHTGV